MKNKVLFLMAVGLAITTLAPSAMAKDCSYFKVLSTQTALPETADVVPIEKVLTYPVVVEKTSTMTTDIAGISTPVLVEEITSLPVMLEKTSIAKPHHWPISFGVWP